MLFEKIFKFLSKSIISNFLGNLQLIKLILNGTGPYEKVFLIKKNLFIPPLIHNQYVVDFKQKTSLFISFFSKQWTHIKTGSNLTTQILRRTNESLNNINFIEDDILSIIRKLDPNRAWTWSNQHSHVTKLCQSSFQIVAFEFFFFYRVRSLPNWIEDGQMHVVLIHKRDDKQNVRN